MIIDQLFTRPLFEQAPMASPEQLAYNKLRAQYDGYQAMTSGDGNTAVSRDPAHAAKLAKVPAELARMAAALKAKGIDAEAQYDALGGDAAAPVDANQAYDDVEEGRKRKKKKTSRSLGRYFFPGYGYYGSGDAGEGGGDGGGGESANPGMAEGSVDHRALGKHHEEMTDQELRKVGSKLPDSWDAAVLRRKLASHPKYAQALKHYNKSEYHFGKAAKQGVAEGFLGDRTFNRVMPIVKRIAGEVSDYDRDEFGEELWSLLDQKYGYKFAQSVLQDSLDFYWDEYTELTGQGLDEASVYKKDQDLSSISTQELEAFVNKHWAGGIPTWGQGESVKRAMRELRRRQKQGVAEGSEQKPAITYKDYTLQYDYQTEDDDPEGYSTATTYYFDVFKDGKRVGEAEYFDYFGNLKIRINGKTKEFGFRHPLASQISQLVSSLPDEQKKDLSDPKFESQGVAEGYQDDSKEREENLRYSRSRNPVADAIRKKLNPNQKEQNKEKGVTEGSEQSLQKKIQAKRDALGLAREQRRQRGQHQQGPREIKLQAEIDKLSTELHRQKQGVTEGSNNDYQQGVDDGVEYFLYTDGEGDTIKDVFLQMKRSATEPKSKKYWRGVVDGMKSVQSEEQVDQGVAEGLAGYDVHKKSTSNNNSSPELRGITIPGDMKHPGWKEPTWSFQEVAEKLGVSPKELQQLALSIGNFPKKVEGLTSRYGSKAYYPRSEIKRWVNATDIRNIIKSKQDIAEGLTEMDKSETSAGRDGGPRPGPVREAKPISAKKATKDAADMLNRAFQDSHKKKDVKESDTLMLKLKRALIKEGRVKELADDLKTMPDADFMKKYGKAKAAIRRDMKRVDEAPINELSTNKLAQYKTAAARDAKKADQAGDFKRGDKRFHGIVKATKKQFDNDAKKVDESRAARRALMARIVNSR